MNEIWKEIGGNREKYEVSTLGEVRTKERTGSRGNAVKSHYMKQRKNSNGYLRVTLNLTGKSRSYFVHRLVATCFLERKPDKNFVNHIDGNKENNCVENLEWCSRSENELHAWMMGLKNQQTKGTKGEKHGMHKLTQEQVSYIRKVHKPYDPACGSQALAALFGVCPQTITNIVNNKNWIAGDD